MTRCNVLAVLQAASLTLHVAGQGASTTPPLIPLAQTPPPLVPLTGSTTPALIPLTTTVAAAPVVVTPSPTLAAPVATTAPVPAPVPVPVIPPSPPPTETLGCFQYNYGYKAFLSTPAPTIQNSTTLCQKKCQETAGCKGFTWWMPPKMECDLSGTATTLMPTTSLSGGAISGPRECPKTTCLAGQKACTEKPGASFPAGTAEASNAQWPSGMQPTNAQCWPRLYNGFPTHCTPQKVTILEDTANGWPGKCMNLRQVSGVMKEGPNIGTTVSLPPGQTCKDSCLQDILCSVWQIVNDTEVPECWQGGFGAHCWHNRHGFHPTASQRVMHGTYRVLKDLTGIQVMNLTMVFNPDTFGNWTVAAKHCKLYCIANIGCQYWLYSRLSGCWVEDPSKGRVHYPLILRKDVAVTGTDDANAVVAGEMIQHYCGDDVPGSCGDIKPSVPDVLDVTFTVGGVDYNDLTVTMKGQVEQAAYTALHGIAPEIGTSDHCKVNIAPGSVQVQAIISSTTVPIQTIFQKVEANTPGTYMGAGQAPLEQALVTEMNKIPGLPTTGAITVKNLKAQVDPENAVPGLVPVVQKPTTAPVAKENKGLPKWAIPLIAVVLLMLIGALTGAAVMYFRNSRKRAGRGYGNKYSYDDEDEMGSQSAFDSGTDYEMQPMSDSRHS